MPTSKKKNNKGKIVRYTMDEILARAGKLEKGEKTTAELMAMKHGDIDYSDIPELTKEFWENAVLIRSPKKKSITLRMDEEVLAFFKETVGKGYQTFMNDVLRTYAEAHKNPPAKH